MKRILIVSLIILLAKITCFSINTSNQINQDSTVLVTASDLKYANLIFIEHSKLLKENTLLQDQIKNYVNLNNKLTQVDSLRSLQVDKLNQNCAILNKEVKKKNKIIKYWQIGGITISVGFILLLLLK